MCACMLDTTEAEQQHPQQHNKKKRMKSKYGLEDYIYEMENRNFEPSPDPEDIYAQLAQKEKDLILAAELGKALLEKNEELSRANEKLAEEFSHKLEVLEQEKHVLKRRMDNERSELESKVGELQSDLQELRLQLEDNQKSGKQSERDKETIIAEITDQNLRLTNQLKEMTKTEELMNSQLQSMKDQFYVRRTNLHDHVSHLELLRDEINLMTTKKMELERRIQTLSEERDGLSSTLDESADRIVLLERQSREQDILLRNSRRELEELRVTNTSLTDRLDTMSRSVSSPPSTDHQSLLNEMELSETEMGQSSHSSQPREDFYDDEDASGANGVECDDALLDPVFPDREELRLLKQEVLSAYQQARALCDQLRHVRRRDSNTSSTSAIASSEDDSLTLADVKVGLLTCIVQELRALVRELLRREARGGGAGACRSCGRHPAEVQELETALHRAQEASEKVARQLSEREEQLKRKAEETLVLSGRVTVMEAEVAAAREERDLLRGDLSHASASRDELIRRAWESRDQAVGRKNACEIQLARTRVELVQANSQLMEAVQQKVELSQQLDQWQVDMQQLLDEQMRRKLTTQEQKERRSASDSDYSSSGGEKKRNSRLFSLFHR